MLKVGLITTEFLPVWGGISSYSMNLCKGLADKVEFHVLTTSSALDHTSLSQEESRIIEKVKIHAISPAAGVALPSLRYQLALIRKLPKIIKENNLDLIHTTAPMSDHIFRMIGCKIPHVLTYHTTLLAQRQATSLSGIKFRDMHSSEKATLITYPFAKLIEQLSLARTKNIIAVSNTLTDELINGYKYKGKITVIHNGIDLDTFQPLEKQPNSKRRVIFISRLVAWKGPQTVIKAIPRVLQEHKDVVFVLAGAGDTEPWERMLNENGVPPDNYEFCYVNYGDMPQFYNSGDILILPSWLEGFPMCILEGMASGLPAIASNVGDVAFLVKDNETGYLIDKGDHDALAAGLIRLLGDENLRNRMSQNAIDLVRSNYSAEAMGQRTFEVYQGLMENN